MSNNPLYAPWRMDYIRSIEKPEASACFLCDAANAADPEDRRSRLVLWTTEHMVVLINRYPYTSGHLLDRPPRPQARARRPDRRRAGRPARQTTRAVQLLKDAMSPQGFNLGINLGRCAGAGVPGHLHQHAVPRWNGDTNFMTVVADIRVVPQADVAALRRTDPRTYDDTRRGVL